MMEFGKTLKEAREAKGYTISQIAEITRIMPQIIEGLENEQFSRIAAPIYGRGFVKLYCEAVGLDTKQMVEAYMELQTGKKATPPPAPPAPDPTPKRLAPQPPPPTTQPPTTQPTTTTTTPPPPRPATPPAMASAPMSVDGKKVFRIAVVVAVAALVMWGLGFVAKTVYNATMTPPDENGQTLDEAAPTEEQPPANEPAPTAAEPAPAEAAAGPRTPQAIPPLYID